MNVEGIDSSTVQWEREREGRGEERSDCEFGYENENERRYCI
jgi:hypothetical protein